MTLTYSPCLFFYRFYFFGLFAYCLLYYYFLFFNWWLFMSFCMVLFFFFFCWHVFLPAWRTASNSSKCTATSSTGRNKPSVCGSPILLCLHLFSCLLLWNILLWFPTRWFLCERRHHFSYIFILCSFCMIVSSFLFLFFSLWFFFLYFLSLILFAQRHCWSFRRRAWRWRKSCCSKVRARPRSRTVSRWNSALCSTWWYEQTTSYYIQVKLGAKGAGTFLHRARQDLNPDGVLVQNLMDLTNH